jgi:predicted phage gp36 major capsid-like protein
MSDARSRLVTSGPRGFSKRRGRPGREPSDNRQRGALLWSRTGSDVVVTNAFRLLNAT